MVVTRSDDRGRFLPTTGAQEAELFLQIKPVLNGDLGVPMSH